MGQPQITRQKALVVRILSESFKENKSVNFVAGKTKEKISALMGYSYEIATNNGKVYISENQKAVALILFPRKKRFSLNRFYQNFRIAINVIDLSKIPLILRRESIIKKYHPTSSFIHLWFIGVNPKDTGKGYGSNLLEKIIELAESKSQDIYLETSTQRNINFYRTHGFENYVTITSGLPFQLMLFRRRANLGS